MMRRGSLEIYLDILLVIQKENSKTSLGKKPTPKTVMARKIGLNCSTFNQAVENFLARNIVGKIETKKNRKYLVLTTIGSEILSCLTTCRDTLEGPI